MKMRRPRLKVRITAFFLLAIFCTSTWCGCWSRVEIEEMSFISVVGVDRAGPQELLVSFQVVNPRALAKGMGGGGGGNEPPVLVLSVKARTIPDALAKIAAESPRVVRFKQLSTIILGEDLAREGVRDVMDFFTRHWEIRRSIYVLVAVGKAQDVLLKGSPVTEKVPGTAIKMIMERKSRLAPTRYPEALGDFITGLTRAGKDAIASSIRVGPMQENKKDETTGKKDSDPTKEKVVGGVKELVLEGAGVFRGDKLIAFLGPQETRGVRWVQGKVQGGIYTVPTPARGAWASLVTTRTTTRVKPEITKSKIRFIIDIKDRGYI